MLPLQSEVEMQPLQSEMQPYQPDVEMLHGMTPLQEECLIAQNLSMTPLMIVGKLLLGEREEFHGFVLLEQLEVLS